MKQEIWKGLIYQGKDYSTLLEVSNMGKIRNVKTGTIYKLNLIKSGYLTICVSLGSRKNKKCFKVHKAVAESFIPNLNNFPIVNHIDGNKLNNNVNNLEWCTHSYNIKHAITNNLRNTPKGEQCVFSKLNEEDIRYIRANYIPKDKEFRLQSIGKEI